MKTMPRPSGMSSAGSNGQSGSLRILFVMRDELPPYRSDVRALFGTYLPRSGILSDIIGQRRDGQRDVPSWPGGEAIAVGTLRSGLLAQCLVPLHDAWALCRHRKAFDLVQVRDKIRSGVLGWMRARLAGTPFVYWMSFPFVEGFAATAANREAPGMLMKIADRLRVAWSRRLFYGFVLKRADHIFVQSEAMRDWLAAKGYARERMTAVPMGVDTETFQRERIRPIDDPRLDGRRTILYLGVLGRARASTFLLDLIELVRQQEPSALLVLAGDAASDEEAQWIRHEIQTRALQHHVVLTGWLSQAESMRYTVRAEVGLSPVPRGELFDLSSPTKLLEYLALGVPAVANDIPDQELVIHRSGAGLCVPMELTRFRDAVLALLTSSALREACARRGPSYIQEERSYAGLAQQVAARYGAIVAGYDASSHRVGVQEAGR